jgi:glucose-6-phosphate 1-dehydrogenase
MPSAAPCALVIFGASGDLSKLKLVPAVYELAREKLLPDQFALVGYARTGMTDDEYRKDCRAAIEAHARSLKGGKPIDQAIWKMLEPRIFYCAGQYDAPEPFAKLNERLRQVDQACGTSGNRLFYISTPPAVFEPIIQNLGKSGCAVRHANKDPYHRVIIEKPFGRDLASARKLNATCLATLGEEQVYRIDHYLGKETVQNLMVLRFANSIFEPIWNYKYIDHVQITVGETVNADDRAGYYDSSGALRDMVQNHIFQIMALVAMEPPYALDAQSIRDEKVKVYRSIRPIRPNQVDQFAIRGQYGAGTYHDGKGDLTTGGYSKAKGVKEGSRTETFAAIKVFVDNWRWSGMPFYIRTGKALHKKLSEVVVRFRAPPTTLFQKQTEATVYPNDLVIKIAPDEGIDWRLNGKVPGGTLNIQSIALDFFYKTAFHKEPPEAYERLIYDCMLGDQTLFIRGDEAEAAWQIIDPIEQGWAESKLAPQQYTPGSWGPQRAMDLIELDGRRWFQTLTGQPEPIVACSL